ncbi:hypothetical protein [Roseateles noduli]|uniref:hypothetical protein n=1 Tax=Roseateles noduli TaxID=2052484 RepID=UPI003D660D8E
MSKQQNVQQQNEDVERGVRSSASRWRAMAWPLALYASARAAGIDCDRAIIVDLDIDYPGMPQLFGLLLTAERRFIAFEIDTDESHDVIEGVSRWEDVTDQQNLSRHNKEFGIGRGAMALRMLDELNTKPGGV